MPRQRNRLLAWISGDYPYDVQSSSEAGALAPPDLEVRREMLRLELEAEVANLQAEADALMSEASLESPTPSGPRAGDAGAVDVAATPDIAASANEAAVSDTEGPTPAA